jgi:hypothetical protein
MSTKTSFKRIALVAVAALGFGLLSAAPSSASVQGDSLTTVSSTTTYTIGSSTPASITLNQTFLASVAGDTATVTTKLTGNVYTAASATLNAKLPVVTVAPTGYAAVNATQSQSADGLVVSNVASAAGVATGFLKATFAPTEAGTYTVTFTPQTGSAASAITWTVTASVPAGPSATWTKTYMKADTGSTDSNSQKYAKAWFASGGSNSGARRVVPEQNSASHEGAAYSTSDQATAHTAFMTAVDTAVTAMTADTANTSTVVVADAHKLAIGAQVASIAVVLSNGPTQSASTLKGAVLNSSAGTYAPVAGLLGNALYHPLTVEISGPGYVSIGNTTPQGKKFTEVFCSNTTGNYCSGDIASILKNVYVYSDGTTGKGTLTISSGSTLLTTKTIYFSGAVSKIAATQQLSIVPIGSTLGSATEDYGYIADSTQAVADSAAINVKATDLLGNVVTNMGTTLQAKAGVGAGWTATSSDTTCISNTIVVAAQTNAGSVGGVGTYTIQPSAPLTATSGCKATLTISYTTAALTVLTTAAIPFTTGGSTIYGVAFDKVADVAPGSEVTLTARFTDIAGNPVADKDYAAFAAAFTGSAQVTTPIFGTTSRVVGGKTEATLYAPSVPTTLNIIGATAAAAPVAVALQATPLKVTVNVTGGVLADTAQAASDAAAEATDAANAATDAANAAAEAADAATAAAQDSADAVAALSTQVSEMISALKKQITALTNLVIKIQKKVKA